MPTRYLNCIRENCSDITVVTDLEIELEYVDICPTCGGTSIVSIGTPLSINYAIPNQHTENTLIMNEIVDKLSIYSKEQIREKDEKNKRNNSDKL